MKVVSPILLVSEEWWREDLRHQDFCYVIGHNKYYLKCDYIDFQLSLFFWKLKPKITGLYIVESATANCWTLNDSVPPHLLYTIITTCSIYPLITYTIVSPTAIILLQRQTLFNRLKSAVVYMPRPDANKNGRAAPVGAHQT